MARVRSAPSFQKFRTVALHSETYPTTSREAKAVTRKTWISIGAAAVCGRSACCSNNMIAATLSPAAEAATTCRAFSRKSLVG